MKIGCLLLLLGASLNVLANQVNSTSFYQKGEVSFWEIVLDEEVEAERTHHPDDKQIILDLKNVKADKKNLRGLDTSEFSGAVAFITGYEKPGKSNDIRYVVQLRDNVRSKLKIERNKIILMVENRYGVFSNSGDDKKSSANDTKKEQETSLMLSSKKIDADDLDGILANFVQSGRKKYFGRKISLNVQGVAVVDLLKFIADTSGFNIVLDNDINSLPPLSLTINDIPWDQALDIVLKLSKLVAVKLDNILQITTLEKIRAEQQRELDSQNTRTKLEPLVTKVFPISYAILADMLLILKDYLTPERGTITSDMRTNSLIVKDTLDVMDRIKKIVEVLDTQTPQILIESKIVETSESFEKRIGLTKGVSFGYDPVAINGPSVPVPSGPGFSFSTAPDLSDPGILGFKVGVFKRLRNLNLSLQLMENESKLKIISSPRVITQNKVPAQITNTETTSFRIAQPQAAAQGTTAATGVTGLSSFQQVNATLSLNVTPQVTNEGAIVLEVKVQKQSFGTREFTDGPPNMLSRNLSTTALVENGSTVVLGGLYSSSDTENHSGIPVLKDLPLLGWLFRTPYNPKNSRTELVIFITPRIINQEEAGLVTKPGAVDG